MRRRHLIGLAQDLLTNERTHRRHRLIGAVADGGNAIGISQDLLADGKKALQGVEQQNGDECDREGQYATSERKENNPPDKSERPPPRGLAGLTRRLVQRLAPLHRILVSGRGSAGMLDCFGNLTKAPTFSPERAACVAECRVSEHAGLIHPFDVGHDHGPQQQSALLDQLGHFRETQPGIAKDFRGAVLGGLSHDRIFRVHLLHRLFQESHVIDHRKIAPATVASIAQLVRRRPMAQRTVALERFLLSPALRKPDRGRQSQQYQHSLGKLREQPATLTGVTGRLTRACVLPIDTRRQLRGSYSAEARAPQAKTTAARNACLV
jgi:hypothetical protein